MNPNNSSYIEEWKILLLILFIVLIVFVVLFLLARKVYSYFRRPGWKQEISDLSNVLPMQRMRSPGAMKP